MPVLESVIRDDIRAAIEKELSRRGIEIPVGSQGVRALVNAVDTELDAAETAVVTGLPAGEGKDWLIAHPEVGREIMSYVETKRMEEL